MVDTTDEPFYDDAEDFVRNYVGRGGQGWSGFFEPTFFVGAATAAFTGNVSADAFKMAVAKTVSVVRKLFDYGGPDPLLPDGRIAPSFEAVLDKAWNVALQTETGEPHHSIDGATAFHWSVFLRTLGEDFGVLAIPMEYYSPLEAMAKRTPERLSSSQLASRIIAEWLKVHPSPDPEA